MQKGTKLKELRKRRKGWKKKSWPQTWEGIELLFGLIDIKVMSKVLRMIASEGLNRVFEVSLADLQKDGEDQAYMKIRFRTEDVQGRNVLVNFWTLIKAHVDVKMTDNYTLRMFCIGFNLVGLVTADSAQFLKGETTKNVPIMGHRDTILEIVQIHQ
ncbi:hypothetical protein LWI28_022112 [Acer negundo]|uniref:Uncharacterized protein n=1 Tax=Acer negundo TaxID=4023 RepID=A0AAD5IFN2_ACENE|nr:hypothetical protein LWI28_022112 [Acer negundo]